MFLITVSIFITFSFIGIILVRWRALYQKRTRLHALRTWAMRSSAVEPLLQQWIEHMPPEQLAVLLDLLDGYCTSLKWQLDWLFASEIQNAPTFHSALEEGVSTYARTILLSLQMAEDVRAYQAYVAFEKHPNTSAQRKLVQQLYTKIQHEHITPTAQGFFRRSSEQPITHNDRVAAVRAAFTADPARAMAALKEVLTTVDLR